MAAKDALSKAGSGRTTPSGKKSNVRNVDPKDKEFSLEFKRKGQDEPDKITKKVTEAVAEFIRYRNLEESYKEQKSDMAEFIRKFVLELRDGNALQGDYQKTYRIVAGETKGVEKAVNVSQSDSFSAPKKDDIENIKALVGDDLFDEILEKEQVISIRKEIMDNKAKRKELAAKLVEAFGKDEIKEWFVKEERWVAKSGLDKTQYKVGEDKLPELRKFLKPSADSIKDTSESKK